ncbi:hypothetical protein [Myceligenerans indicum]|uniref:DUF4440 domain-containing protein n=1 Tax=Myceligenerans indicum TaxID=2593663 RepID=A0ABS1LRI6_9MICO|nr:hypothetical protein [Myceligenerans indicum]MBL0888628.1 hypothetical protein [Myceligenerans indicum]
MADTSTDWHDRDIAERKVLINACEEAYVSEILPESYVLTAHGRTQDYPALSVNEAVAVIGRVISDGAVGFYHEDNVEAEILGDAALCVIATETIWNPGSGGVHLFLTETGEAVAGLKPDAIRPRQATTEPAWPPTSTG